MSTFDVLLKRNSGRKRCFFARRARGGFLYDSVGVGVDWL